jgi:hypothetical protein
MRHVTSTKRHDTTRGGEMAPRNKGSLAEQLTALWDYRNRPDHRPEPVASNWAVVPANDSGAVARSERLANEKLLKVTPSIEKILRNMREDWVWEDGKLLAIGNLKFSDGNQYEPALVRAEDGKVERRMVKVRDRAMLGCTETLTEDAGGQAGVVTISNAVFCDRVGVPHREFISGGKRRPGKSLSPKQSRAMIDRAIANTPVLPPVTMCPPGVASGTAQYSDQFIGMKIGSTGKGGLIHWVDLYTAGRDWDESKKAIDGLDKDHKETLDAAMSAQTMASLGKRGHRRTRERQALKRLVAANDNFLQAMRKISA